jgi:uncharacterized protein
MQAEELSLNEIELTRLFVYPIKSARGIEVESATVLERGLEHDRRFMLVDDDGHLITARVHSKLLTVTPSIEAESLIVNAPGMSALRFPLEGSGLERKVRVWTDWMPGLDVGAEPSEWFSDFLGAKLRLVWMPDHSERRMNSVYGPSRISFVDGNPLHLVNEASLRDLEARVGSEVAVERFRPNLVVRGAPAFQEDRWTRLRFQDVELQPCEACARCMMVNLEPQTGAFSLEPLRTLASYRRQGKAVLFGHHLHALGHGAIRVGERGSATLETVSASTEILEPSGV